MKTGNHLKSIKEVTDSIRQGQVKPVYLFSGEEDYFVFEARKQTVQAIQSVRTGTSVQILDGENITAHAVIQTLRTPSLFNPYQILVVREVPWFEAGKTALSDPIKEWLSGGGAGGTLILTCRSTDKRLGIVKQIGKSGEHLDFPRSRNFNRYEPRTDDYYPIAQARLKDRNQIIEESAWQLLRQKTSESLWAVINALDVVSTYTGSNPRISRSDVEKCVFDHCEIPGFMVVQEFGDKDPVKIREALQKTLAEGTHPLMVSKSLSNRIRLLINILTMGLNKLQLPPQYFSFRDNILPDLITRYQEYPAARETLAEMNPYALYQLLLQSKRFSMQELTECLGRLAVIDKALKSGASNPMAVLETVVFPLFRIRSSAK